MRTVYLSFAVLPLLLALDFFWISFGGSEFYRSQLGALLAPQIGWQAAAVFYILYSFALAHFVVRRALEANSAKQAVLLGAFFGLVVYAGYDLVNLATLHQWPVLVSIIDMVWGAIMSATAAVGAFLIATFVLRRRTV